MDIIGKIIGIIQCIIGLGMWFIDYRIFTDFGALTAWIVATVGMTGDAVVGVQILGWMLILASMVLLLIFGADKIISGLKLLVEKRRKQSN